MVSHQLTIAKAALAAACIRPDPTPITRDQLNAFHGLLDEVLDRCSSHNVQRCKQWLITNIIQSQSKVAAIGKYLAAVSASLKDEAEDARAASPRRKHVHGLYLVNDLLHSIKFHGTLGSAFDSVSQTLAQHVASLFAHAASYSAEQYPRHHSKLNELIEIWTYQQLYSPETISELTDALRNGDTGVSRSLPQSTSAQGEGYGNEVKKEAPFDMPATHGDPSAAYYELPAATMLPHIDPKRKTPIDPRQMTALQFKPGPADQKLVSAVKDFLRDADVIYGLSNQDHQDVSMDLDEIGQAVYQNKATGEILGSENYYGWSKRFCEKMKRSPSENSSRSHSRSRARARDSRSDSRSLSQSRSRSRSRLRERSSRHRQRFEGNQRGGSRSRSYSRSRSRSKSSSRSDRDRRRRHSSSSDRGRYASGSSRAPPGAQGPPFEGARPVHGQAPYMPPAIPTGVAQAQHPLPFPFAGGIPLGPNGLPIPPPRPPNWVGPWPPMPPPPSNLPPPPFGQFPSFFQGPPPGL